MNILTFDIEDWWVYDHFKLGRKKDYLPRLNRYLSNVLDLLDEKGFTATFFCLGKVAEEYPKVIKLIDERGHHIGCHSYSHMFFNNASRKKFEDDTKKALDLLENLIGKKITAYRAPAFSITEKNIWAFDVLADNGILFDCSIFPASRSFGGFSTFETDKPVIIKYNDVSIKEFPVSLTKLLRKRIAYSGGGYFRLFPYRTIQSIINKKEYVMTYFHIKDFDKDQLRKFESYQDECVIERYFKRYIGLSSSFSKFKRLLSDFNFLSLEQADKRIDWKNSKIIEF